MKMKVRLMKVQQGENLETFEISYQQPAANKTSEVPTKEAVYTSGVQFA